MNELLRFEELTGIEETIILGKMVGYIHLIIAVINQAFEDKDWWYFFDPASRFSRWAHLIGETPDGIRAMIKQRTHSDYKRVNDVWIQIKKTK